MYKEILETVRKESDDPDILASRLADGVLAVRVGNVLDLESAVESRRAARFIVESVQSHWSRETFEDVFLDFLEETPRGAELRETPLRELLPPSIQDALHRLLARHYRADPELVRRLVEHSAIRKVLRNVLEETLLEFVNRMTEWIQESGTVPGMGRAWSLFTRFFGLARRYTRRFLTEFEERVTERIDVFVDGMIDEVLEKLVMQLTAEETVSELAEWRVKILERFLERPLNDYVRQIEAYEDSNSEDSEKTMDGSISSEELVTLVEPAVDYVVRVLEDRRIEEVLEAVNLEDRVRNSIHEFILEVLEARIRRED